MSARPNGAGLWVGLLLVGMIVVVGLMANRGPGPIGSMATGLDGLPRWLSASGQEARRFTGGYTLEADAIGLRVLPLYDAAPGQDRAEPETERDLLMSKSERDVRFSVIFRKASAVPTLIVLPKWRAGMRITRNAHPTLLIPDITLDPAVQRLMGEGARLSTDAQAGFRRIPLGIDGGALHRAALYAPRSAVAPDCTPILGDAAAAYLLECPLPGSAKTVSQTVWILTDPDILNNHGLALGDNAALVADLIASLSRDGAVIVDYSTEVWARTTPRSDPRKRDWADLAPLFQWPFSVIWLGFAALLALALWRGAVRTRPLADIEDEPRRATVETEARLLLLSGDEARLMADYADQRLAALAEQLFGLRAGVSMLRRVLDRRAPDLSAALFGAAKAMHHLPKDAGPTQTRARIRDFEALIERVHHELG